MRVWILSALALLLLTCVAFAQDDKAEVTVHADVTADQPTVPEGEVVVAPPSSEATDTTSHTSLRQEYRQWRGDTRTRSTATYQRSDGSRVDVNPDSTDDFDSVNDIEGTGRDVEDYVNEDLLNTDRDNYVDSTRDRAPVATRRVNRYADYPEYDNDSDPVNADRLGDRMHDDYDRGSRYWSRAYDSDRYWDSRSDGCPCNKCSKCARSYGGNCGGSCSRCGYKSQCSKCGVHKEAVYVEPREVETCDRCTVHKPAVTSCGKCGVSKCSSCGTHKPAVSNCGCGKCGAKKKCGCGRTSKKCSRC